MLPHLFFIAFILFFIGVLGKDYAEADKVHYISSYLGPYKHQGESCAAICKKAKMKCSSSYISKPFCQKASKSPKTCMDLKKFVVGAACMTNKIGGSSMCGKSYGKITCDSVATSTATYMNGSPSVICPCVKK